MAVTAKNPSKLRQHQALTDKQIDQVMKEYRSKLKTELLNMVIRPVIRQPAPALSDSDAGDCSAPDPALREKAHAYIERQFGKSSLSRLEQADCVLVCINGALSILRMAFSLIPL